MYACTTFIHSFVIQWTIVELPNCVSSNNDSLDIKLYEHVFLFTRCISHNYYK